MKNLTKLWTIIAAAAVLTGLGGCNTLQAIDVQAPAKTVLGQGQELDTSGLAVMAHYKKNSERVTNTGSLVISGYNKHTPGVQTVTVTMNATSGLARSKASNTFTVTVVPVERISILQPPVTTALRQGDNPNWNGLNVQASFENGAVPNITVKPGSDRLNISGYDKDRAGTQVITVDYYGKKAAFDVKVAGLDSIAVTAVPRQTEYYTGEELDLTGLVVQGTWSDGSTAQVNITNNDLSGYDITRGGKQNVTVTYSRRTAVFTVTYIAFEALSVDRPPVKTKYELGETLDTMGIRVLGTWPGHSMAIVNNERLKITGYDPLRVGEQRITVTAGGQRDYFLVTVINPFEGTWRGQWKAGSEVVEGRNRDILIPVSISLEGSAWMLRTSNLKGEQVELRGVYIPDSNTHAKLQCTDSRGAGDLNRDSSTVMRLRNNYFSGEITLNKR